MFYASNAAAEVSESEREPVHFLRLHDREHSELEEPPPGELSRHCCARCLLYVALKKLISVGFCPL